MRENVPLCLFRISLMSLHRLPLPLIFNELNFLCDTIQRDKSIVKNKNNEETEEHSAIKKTVCQVFPIASVIILSIEKYDIHVMDQLIQCTVTISLSLLSPLVAVMLCMHM